MHTFQLASEDYSVQNDASYAADVSGVTPLLPRGGATFLNPFNKTVAAWLDAGAWAVPLTTGSTIAGIVAYQDSVQQKYQVVGRGKSGELTLVLTSGQ
jgi:hypothetical protein